MRWHRLIVVAWLVLAVAASTALAAPPSFTPAAAAGSAGSDDPRGPILDVGVSLGLPFVVASADATAGWRVATPVAVVVRVAANLSLGSEIQWNELQLGLRVWSRRQPGVSFEAHAGAAAVDDPPDCWGTSEIMCTGGRATGVAWGATVRWALTRGRRASLDLTAHLDVVRWRDASEDVQDSVGVLGAGLGLSLH